MKTNTEKAIEFLNDCQDDYEELQEEGNNKGILEVIKLLQRGEKFEAIEKEIEYNLDWHRPECPFTTPDTELIDEILRIIADIKRKYFPKPVKRTIRIEIEGGDDIDLGLAKMIMKKALTDWNFKKDIKFKECD